MFYVKLNPNGTIYKYPYTLTDLQFDNPNVSFPDNFGSTFSDADAQYFNVYPVTPSRTPDESYDINLERTAEFVNGEWVEVWVSLPASQEQIAERTAAKSVQVINVRNEFLKDSDWTQLSDIPESIKTSWSSYRQLLRDIPQQNGFPWNVVWPDKPST